MTVVRRDFHFADRAIRVEGPSPVLRWLEEFLAPQFRAITSPRPDRTIRFSVDPRGYADLRARGPHAQPGRVACFTLDTGVLSAARWKGEDDEMLAFDEAAGVFYRRSRNESRVVEMIGALDAGPARVALMRMVREFAMMYAARAGWLLVHGAAVQLGDGAVVIAGPKGAGKTTLLLHALRHERGAYISNDRVAIRLEGARAFVHGVPTIVSVRGGSTAWFPALEAALAEGWYDSRRLLGECPPSAERALVGRPAKWSLSPPQLCHVLAAESRAAGRVSALLFPEVLDQPGPARLEELPSALALTALRDALFRPFPQDGMFRIDGMPDVEADAPSLAARLVSGVPAFRCLLGRDAYAEGPGWLGRLITRAGPP